MSEKDKANLLAVLDAVTKIEQFTSPFLDPSSSISTFRLLMPHS
jgi:hypothetical protein